MYDYPKATLYLSREDRVAGGLLFGGLQISFIGRKATVNLDDLKRATGHLVLVRGRFKAAGDGPANIGEIQWVDTKGGEAVFSTGEYK